MTRRTKLLFWARSGEVTDPDLDPTHPSGNGGPDKYINGWIVEKEPHQWANFLYGSQVAFQMESGQQGTPVTTFATHKDLSIAWLSDKQVVRYQGAWVESFSNYSPTEYNNLISSGNTSLANHIATTYSHQLTAEQVNTYIKSVVDTKLLPIPNHIAMRGNTHNLTAIQVGTIPSIGGEFTGLVELPSAALPASVKLTPSTFGTSSKYFKLVNNELIVVVNSAYTSGQDECLISEATFPLIKAKYTPRFIAPEPSSVFLANINNPFPSNGFGDFEFVRGTGGALSITSVGLLLESGNTYYYEDLFFLKNGGTATAIVDGVFQHYSGVSNTKDLVAFIGAGKRFRNLQIWPFLLTTEQILHLTSVTVVPQITGFSDGFSNGFAVG